MDLPFSVRDSKQSNLRLSNMETSKNRQQNTVIEKIAQKNPYLTNQNISV